MILTTHFVILVRLDTKLEFTQGCTTAGNYAAVKMDSAAECCEACARNVSCQAWTYHAPETTCNLAVKASVRIGVPGATCGCRQIGCVTPPPPPGPCVPVVRPPKSTPAPLPSGRTTQPHLVSILVDDLGFYGSSIRGDNLSHTPTLTELRSQGILLDRHHTYLWCSPTRRSFLTGRYPVHVTGTQAPTCSNLTPLQFTLLSEKLHAVGYESAFVGKGHLGYQTTDHLPVNRGFTRHVGFLGGGESYAHGLLPRCQDDGHNDMWRDAGPAVDDVAGDYYSTNFFTDVAIDFIRARNKSRPFWLHMTYQAVHTGAARLPPPWEQWTHDVGLKQSLEYRSAMHVLDMGLANLTATLKAENMWENTLFVLMADNGGDCGLMGGDANNWPLLGRKCTAWEGGTRTAAFVSGGLVPPALRGTVNTQLMHVADWYPTFAALGGVDASDDWTDPATGITHGIDGINLWPALTSVTSQHVPLHHITSHHTPYL